MKFQWPVDVNTGSYIIQPFGGHNRDYSPLLGHPGIDFYATRGAPVFAVCDGWLYQAVGVDNNDGYGIHLYQWYEENGNDFVVVYGHFQRLALPSQNYGFAKVVPIARGQLLGFCNSTGFSNIDHVHIGKYEYHFGQLLNSGNGYGGSINWTADLLPESDFIHNMSNAVFVHKAGTAEYGWYIPDISPDAIKSSALHYAAQIVKPDGSVDFSQSKEVSGL